MTEKYVLAEDIKEIAKQFISEHDNFSYLDMDEIVFVRTKKHIKSGNVLGQCALLSDRTRFLTEKIYMIEFPPVFDSLTDAQKLIVLEHELTHILPAEFDEKGNEKPRKLRDHDIGEFNEIIRKYGLDWVNVYKDVHDKIENLIEAEKLEKKAKKLLKKKDDPQEEDKNDE